MIGARSGRGRAGDPLARPHPRAPRHLLDARAVRRAQHELVGALVVEVDEARVGVERVGDLARDELEHLLEVERRVDRRDRLGQQAQMARGASTPLDCRLRSAEAPLTKFLPLKRRIFTGRRIGSR